MTSNWIRPAAVLLALVVLPAVAGAGVREKMEKSYPFSETGIVRVQNVNGSIAIEGWDRQEVHLEAVRKASSRSGIDRIQIDIDYEPAELTIETRYDRGWTANGFFFWEWFAPKGEVSYTLRVPRGAEIRQVRTVNGDVRIRDVRGEIRTNNVNGSTDLDGVGGVVSCNTVNGGVTVALASDASVDNVSLRSCNGRLRLAVPEETDARITAKTVNGGIRTDFEVMRSDRGWFNRSLQARLGDGTGMVHMRTVNGGIRIEQTDWRSASR